jgi:hypothetical protein
MTRLYGAQRLVLQAILDAQGESSAFIEDTRIAQTTLISLREIRDWFLTLDQGEYVDLALTEDSLKAGVTPKGRLAMGVYRPFPTKPTPSLEAVISRGRTGRERALVIGISSYPSPIPKLPAVANDVREMAKLLSSDQRQFPAQNVRRLVDREATHQAILEAIDSTFSGVQANDTVFAYLAGHGAVAGGKYYFVAHNTTAQGIAANGVPLTSIKAAFDSSPSQRAFLWLDFCHSGGIIPRDLGLEPDDRDVIGRTLQVFQGQGKLIVAACTPSQSAWESSAAGHGLFTDALLKGLRGEAADKRGEVTANSLYDYIDWQMGSDQQRPMMFGQLAGRVVLMHCSPEPSPSNSPVDGSTSNPPTEDLEKLLAKDYSGYWIYEIINYEWTIEVYASMFWAIDPKSQLMKAKGKVWKKGKHPDPTDFLGEWDSEPFELRLDVTNLFFSFVCYEEYENDQKLRIPLKTYGVVRVKLHRDFMEGVDKDFEPERRGYGSFRGVRVRKSARSLEEAGREAFEVFGTPSEGYAEWLRGQRPVPVKAKKHIVTVEKKNPKPAKRSKKKT